jgi:4'-phosphopantetheinyl transferase
MSDGNSWSEIPSRLALGETEIHVWRAALDLGESLLGQLQTTLSPGELARANRFHFERDRNCFIATRGILRDLLGKYLGRSPAEFEFDYSARGKPSLRRTPLGRSIQFNVSHSHGLALQAFAVERDLGIDVELIRRDMAHEEIAKRYFSPQEVAELEALPPSLRAEGFCLCWTRKEAYIKARGEGLHIPLDSFRVSLTPGQPASLQSDDSSNWSLRALIPGPQHAGAVVGEGCEWRLRCWDWSPVAQSK